MAQPLGLLILTTNYWFNNSKIPENKYSSSPLLIHVLEITYLKTSNDKMSRVWPELQEYLVKYSLNQTPNEWDLQKRNLNGICRKATKISPAYI